MKQRGYTSLQNDLGKPIKCRCLHVYSTRLAIKALKLWGLLQFGYVSKIWLLLIHFAMIAFISSSVVCWKLNNFDLNFGMFSDFIAGLSYYVDWWLCWQLIKNHGLKEKVIGKELGLSSVYFSSSLMFFTMFQDLWVLAGSEDLDYDSKNETTDMLSKVVKLCFNITNVVVGPWARPCSLLIAVVAMSQLQQKISDQLEKLGAGNEEPWIYRRDISKIGKLARDTTYLVSVLIGQIVIESIFRFFWLLAKWKTLKLEHRVFLVCNYYFLAQTGILIIYQLTRVQKEKAIGIHHLLTDNASYQMVELARGLPTACIFGFEMTGKKLARMTYLFITFLYTISQLTHHKDSF